ncbi:DUF3088 domain-containing protein [Pseudodesulfovibrio piezophilus]|uniref:DUF3088 domain-containing protein n=1 Tax=Pseudodesulfovibrio piezophilus (strain DSM 21447 / JCM 15486 / C1TLV30) TaxID=1322246 RepID=M1WJQ5_PSEP2|nr:DUF3088 domain-containing protein [Pseudodesulfovibrio piezophilus]CCH48306.1 conserved protein of unknown function [Pseudodesulfovibrio piezophilus C1TLV30]
MKDILFLLRGDFTKDTIGPFYCPDCIALEGILSYFPELREKINVVYVDYDQPRKALVDVLGEENQSCPALVLANPAQAGGLGITVKKSQFRSFLDDQKDILHYLHQIHGTSRAAS